MIPEIGHIALILALGIAVIQAFFPLAGAQLVTNFLCLFARAPWRTAE